MEEKAVISLENRKVEIKYPCIWKYKVIIRSGENIEEIVATYIKKEYKTKKSNNSKRGVYESYSLETFVNNEDERTYIYEELKRDSRVKMIL